MLPMLVYDRKRSLPCLLKTSVPMELSSVRIQDDRMLLLPVGPNTIVLEGLTHMEVENEHQLPALERYDLILFMRKGDILVRRG
jgi:hypothetical protein